ncbi:MAG: gamma-glutamylcyclotransferase family protein [Verrucomicrobiota bacterium]
MSPRVFVYGTLKPGGYYWPSYAEGKVTAHGAAKVQGRLYDLAPGYPGLTLSEGWAEGVLLTLVNTAALAGFDELEGYVTGRDPALNEYQRVEVPCYSLDEEPLGIVWTYCMNEEKVQALGGIYLPEGRWDGPLSRD